MCFIKDFNDPIEFLNELGRLKYELKKNEQWIFRGHNNASYSLIPSLYRFLEIKNCSKILKFAGDDVIDAATFRKILNNFCNSTWQYKFSFQLDENQKKRLCSIVEHSLIDLALTKEFLKECLHVELDVTHHHQMKFPHFIDDDPLEVVWGYMDCLIEKFIMGMRLLENTPLHNLNLINDKTYNCINRDAFPMRALSRHHGIPSRLLDWTEEPFYAAYFSVDGWDIESKVDVCVWALNTQYIQKNDAVTLHGDFTKQGLEYLKKQKAILIELNYYDSYYYRYGNWALLHEYLDYNEIDSEKTLKCFVLKSTAVNELKEILRTKKIHKHHLMPSYDNVGEYTKNYYTK